MKIARLLPALLCAFVLSAPASAGYGDGDKKKAKANIVETAKSAGMFNTLLAAATAAGLADTLANGGPFTVFAPTDEAFAALPEGTVESLLEPANIETLKTILLFHVVEGKVMAKDVATGEVPTLAGEKLSVRVNDAGVKVGEASVIKTDVRAKNGVIHVIDTVLIP